MAQTIELSAELRTAHGKGATRRLRRLEAKVPAVIYGGGKEPRSIALGFFEVTNASHHEGFYSQILNITIAGEREQAILRDVQRHPASENVTHLDFQRVLSGEMLHVQIPIHFLNEDRCVGVRLGAGSIAHNLTDVEIECLPKDLPQYIEVDMLDKAVGATIHLSDLVLPAGVSIPSLAHGEDYDLMVVAVHAPRGAEPAPETPAA